MFAGQVDMYQMQTEAIFFFFLLFPLLKCNCCSFIIVEFMTDRAAAD